MSTENSTSSQFFASLYKSRQIIIHLLSAQGYDTSEYYGFSTNELHSMLSNKQLDMFIEENKQNNRKVYVKYHNILHKVASKVNVEAVIEDLYKTENLLTKEDTLMIISNDDPNSTLQTYLKDIWEQEGYYVAVVSMKRLQFNVLEHELVPPHEVLNEEKKAKFMKQYQIRNEKQIPEISRFDPVCVALGVRPGEVCKIKRSSKTAITAPYYRICLNI